MSGEEWGTGAIGRILVAADGSEHSLAALDAALALAARLHAELEALFVEDLDLLRLAELPCARVVSLTLLQSETIDRERMERQLRLQSARVHQALEQRAATLRVQARFRSVRGEVPQEVASAAAGADLVGLGKAGHGRMAQPHLGRTLRAALAAGRPLLVAERQSLIGTGLLVLYGGEPADRRALALAHRLASGDGETLTVLLLGPLVLLEHLANEVQARLAGSAWRALRSTAAEPVAAVRSAVARLRPALLVLGVDAGSPDSIARAGRMMAALRCPVLLVP